MKIVINKCFGGFGLSPKAIKRIAELEGKECYFFKCDIKSNKYPPLSLEEAKKSFMFLAFSVQNPEEVLPEERKGKDGTYKEFNKTYNKISLDSREHERNNPFLIQVVEELGVEANGQCAELEIVEIPDDVEWDIDDYDGVETIHEKHRSWD